MALYPPRRLTQQFVNAFESREKSYVVRDTEQKGFMVVVNKRSKSYVVQRDLWQGPRGHRRLVGTRRVLIGRVSEILLKDARTQAREVIALLARGEDPTERSTTSGVTLRKALESYEDWLQRKGRSARTIQWYRYALESSLAEWLDRPLIQIGRDRRGVRELHRHLTDSKGPYMANHAMRALRAVYRYERRVQPDLPDCPVDARDFNDEAPREKFISKEELPIWAVQVRKLPNTVRRDLHFFMLFTGMRREAACRVRWEDLDEHRAVLRIPLPKGGKARAFELPLCREGMGLLEERRKENRVLVPNSPWVFPARSRSGHVMEPRESDLPSPHVLRHTFSTHATAAGIAFADLQLLLNHRPARGVTGGYIHAPALIEHLREQQQLVVDYLVKTMASPTLKIVPHADFA